MSDISTILLYVSDPQASVRFYSDLLGQPVIESHPNFAMLPIAPGVMLGLWAMRDVAPSVTATADAGKGHAAGELAITVADHNAVLKAHSEWVQRKIRIIQEPLQLDFGFTFTALDPDGHRLRVMALTA